MLQITDDIYIDENEIHLKFIQSSGPGGQNVNKVSSAVQLKFDVINSPSLPEQVRIRLLKMDNRINKDGILVITAKRYRLQERNKQDAINRLIFLVKKATVIPKPRKRTKQTFASKQKRLDIKLQRSKIKKTRKPVSNIED